MPRVSTCLVPAQPFEPSRGGEMASPLFCECLRDHFGLELFFDVHLAESAVFFLQLLHARHQRGIHATELRAPLVERGRADAHLAAQLGHGKTSLYALERLDDLAVGESGLLHGRNFPSKASTSHCVGFAGGLPTQPIFSRSIWINTDDSGEAWRVALPKSFASARRNNGPSTVAKASPEIL